jgi:outer membrane protein TolC
MLRISSVLLAGFLLVLACGRLHGQTASADLNALPQASAAAPLTLTFHDALERARRINPEYRAAATESGIAKEDRVQTRAALLPNANLTATYLYTQGGGIPDLGRFIANNRVHEYFTQGDVKEVLSLGNVADYKRANAAAALAQARAEIAQRGLVVTVTQAYYGLIVAQRKYANAQRSISEAQSFHDKTSKLEQGGEVAHADTVKARIQALAKQRDLAQAELEMNRSRLDLAVLVFPDFNQNFTVVDDLGASDVVPGSAEVQQAAGKRNPQLRAALAALQVAQQERTAAVNGFLPSLTLDYFYGIDAPHYAVNEPFSPALGFTPQNLGYAAAATLDLPVWNWGANRSRLKQADLRRDQAKTELSATQRELLANLQAFYQELKVAHDQMDSLRTEAQLAGDSLRLTTLRYQAGEATVLEVVDAQNTLIAARNALDDGELRFQVANATLQTLTGPF